MQFILIMFMLHTWGGGSAAATFANRASCESAGAAFQNMFDTRKHSAASQLSYRPWLRQFICVPYDIARAS